MQHEKEEEEAFVLAKEELKLDQQIGLTANINKF